MSILNLVLTPAGAWLLTDSAVSADPGPMASGVTDDPAEAARTAFASRPAGAPARVAAHVLKHLALPRARLVAAGTGHGWMLGSWFDELRLADPADVMEVVDAAPARLRALAEAFPGGGAAAAVFNPLVVGWNARMGRTVAFAFCSADGFRPVALPDGTALCPTVAADDGDYPRLYELSTRANEGPDAAEAFLVAAAANQVRSFRRGLYGNGVAFGGPLRLAEITERGVGVRVVGEG